MNQQPDELYHKLFDSVQAYYPAADISIIEEAYRMACEAHEGQLRKSGAPYVIHPLNVALILSEMRLDQETIAAALLHETLGYTGDGGARIREQFGDEICFLVLGAAKLGKLPYAADKLESQAENFRKMFLAMARDIRVILIKLADRLHNMRELGYQTAERQREVSRETLEIYAPIAQRLGISMISMELEDLALKYLYPEVYYDLTKRVELTKAERQQFIDRMIGQISEQLKESHVDAVVAGRFKHFFSIYRKMVKRGKTLDDMYDLFAIRIIVDTIKECYAVLGMIHELYTPIPGRFKDYISMPKSNMYRSLHTTVLDGTGQSFEIQIRTKEMHRTAEYGIAAHWKYKEGKGEGLILNKEEEKLNWLKQVLEWQREMSDNKEFMSLLKNDFNLMSESIYCFTPKGEVKNLPDGAIIIDFAYSIHSAVGNTMVGARVNGEPVPIDYVIQNGDRIEVLTSQNSPGPSKEWLKLVKSAQARNKINQWFREAGKEENIKRGTHMLQEYCAENGVDESLLANPEHQNHILRKFGYHDWDSVLAAVGHGALKESRVIGRMETEEKRAERKAAQGAESHNTNSQNAKMKEAELHNGQRMQGVQNAWSLQNAQNAQNARNGQKEGGTKRIDPFRTGAYSERRVIVGNGSRGYAVNFAKCCTPLPGDEIAAFVTKGRGVTIHRTDCVNVINLPEPDRARLLDAEWDDTRIQNAVQRNGMADADGACRGVESAGSNADEAGAGNRANSTSAERNAGGSGVYLSEIRILAKNRVGMIADISAVLAEGGMDIASMDCKIHKQGMATLNVVFEVTDKRTLEALIQRLMEISGVEEIRRGNG